MLVHYVRATTKRTNFITKDDDALCILYGSSNNDAFFSLLLVPSLFSREKSGELKIFHEGTGREKNVKNKLISWNH